MISRVPPPAVGTATAQTNVTWTVNSAGLSLNAGGYAGTGFTSTTTAGTAVVGTNNTAGLSLGVPAFLTTAALSNHSHGNPTLNLTNLSGTTASNSAGFTLSLSAAAGGGGADGYNILAAGTQTAGTATTVNFANSNGITFGMSGSSQITASYTVPSTAGLLSAVNVSAGTTSNNLSALTFANGGGVSFGLNASTVTATVATTYRASNDAVGLNTALTAGPLAWTVNSSGISLNASSAAGTTSGFAGNLISGSMTHNTAGLNLSLNHPAWLTTAMQSNAATISNINVSAGTTSTNASAFTFANANGVSFGLGTGASVGSITASHNGLTSQSNQNVTAGNGGFAFQTLSFSNVNGISFGTSAGSAITASHNAITTARASTDGIGLNTAQTNVTWTVNSSGLSLNASGYAGTATAVTGGASITLNSGGLSFNGTALAGTGTTFNGANISASITLNSAGLNLSASVAAPGGGATPVASASNGSFSFTTIAFSNANNVTFGTSAGSIITASVAAPGAAAENNWVNLLGANTSGNTTASGSTIGYSGINLTLSGTNGSVVNISAPATSSLSATGAFSISTNGSTISMGVPSTQNVYAVGNTFGTSSGTGDYRTLSVSAGSGLQVAASNSGFVIGIQPDSQFEPYPILTGTAYSSHAPASWWANRFYIADAPVVVSNANVWKSLNASVPGATSQASTGTARFSYSHGMTLVLPVAQTGNSTSQWTTVGTASWGMTAGLSYSSTSQSFVMSWVTDSTGGTSSTNTTSNAGNWSSWVTGPRRVQIPWVTTLQPGEYFLLHRHSSTTGTTASNVTLCSVSNLHIAPQVVTAGVFGTTGTNNTVRPAGAGGIMSALTSTTTQALSVMSAGTQNNWYVAFSAV